MLFGFGFSFEVVGNKMKKIKEVRLQILKFITFFLF